jgi:hypothetical protein
MSLERRGESRRNLSLFTAIVMEGKIHKMVARAIMAGKRLHATELGELIDLLRHAAHAEGEMLKDLMPRDDDGGLTSMGANRLEAIVQDPWTSWGLHTRRGS